MELVGLQEDGGKGVVSDGVVNGANERRKERRNGEESRKSMGNSKERERSDQTG